MSKKERRVQKRKEREEKLLEMIRNGKAIRVHFEDRKKKVDQPNSKCSKKTPEEEMADRQEKVSIFYDDGYACKRFG